MTKIIRECISCNKSFTTIPSRIANGRGKYCTKACEYAARKGRPLNISDESRAKMAKKTKERWLDPSYRKARTETLTKYWSENSLKIQVECQRCGIIFTSLNSAIVKGRDKFCSRKCARPGRAKAEGYIMLYKPDHPNAMKRGYVMEHTFIAEKILGRFLNDKERIHHINKIRTDNRPENLYLFSTNGEHTSYHLNADRYKTIPPITESNLPMEKIKSYHEDCKP